MADRKVKKHSNEATKKIEQDRILSSLGQDFSFEAEFIYQNELGDLLYSSHLSALATVLEKICADSNFKKKLQETLSSKKIKFKMGQESCLISNDGILQVICKPNNLDMDQLCNQMETSLNKL